MSYTNETSLIITTDTISSKTIKQIVNGMGYAKVVKFVQDGECGWVRLEGYDGSRVWQYVATMEAATMITGAY
jgi:TusA-related sulfurtransferase